ncbi:hypothetical protein [Poseidonibacter ostreae]|nr:hypothetical protein [Poseidonibacter ostreae]
MFIAGDIAEKLNDFISKDTVSYFDIQTSDNLNREQIAYRVLLTGISE